MVYSRDLILTAVRRRLAVRPFQQLSHVAAELQIDRHTLTRTLNECGTSFTVERKNASMALLSEQNATGSIMSYKQLAVRLGCSRRTLYRLRTRLSGNAPDRN